MSEVNPRELKAAIESQHGGTATLVQSVPVREKHEDETIWHGIIHIFDLKDHPKATRAYAWSYELPNGTRRFFAMLHVPPINGPAEAVKVAMAAEAKGEK